MKLPRSAIPATLIASVICGAKEAANEPSLATAKLMVREAWSSSSAATAS